MLSKHFLRYIHWWLIVIIPLFVGGSFVAERKLNNTAHTSGTTNKPIAHSDSASVAKSSKIESQSTPNTSSKSSPPSVSPSGRTPPSTPKSVPLAAPSVTPTQPVSTSPTPQPPISTYNTTVLFDLPVAFWNMNGAASGSETDISLHGYTGSYKGGTPSQATLPNGDNVAVFNGSSEYLTVPSASAFSISTTQKLTWEAWIRPDTLQFLTATNGYVDWLGKCQNYSPSCEWEGRMYTTSNPQNRCNRLSAYAFNSGAGLGSGADWQPNCGLIQVGQWLHVVGEYQTLMTPSRCNTSYPGDINIWVNGVPWNSTVHGTTGCMSQYSVTPSSGNSPLNIGTMALDYWFGGAIGKVAVYNYSLSQAQITNHYSAMTNSQPSGSCSVTCTYP